ncbi:MAG: type II toxin-antitoxin system VapC family toxin [Nitrospirae bacterium]|nr:type II toxin-antitoxin system VapC family toxin [Nitrospirota bacterium]
MLVDSSGWIEFFSGGHLADRYGHYLKDPSNIITPSIVLYEVYKKIKREYGEETAVLVAGQLNSTKIIPLSESIALFAADMSLQHGLAMADAIVYATSQDQGARIVTSDADLKDLPNVVYMR